MGCDPGGSRRVGFVILGVGRLAKEIIGAVGVVA